MKLFRLPIFLLCLQVITAFAETAGNLSLDESQIKALYLYKFIAYVDWPTDNVKKNPQLINIGVLGEKGLVDELNQLNIDAPQKDYRVHAINLITESNFESLQMIYVNSKNISSFKEHLEKLDSAPILIVTDFPNGLNDGGIINFIPVEDRIRFEISLNQAEKRNLKISARLLSVAYKVEPGATQ